jgi:NNP family nitrate/nitrite transporter-like MFS transporter
MFSPRVVGAANGITAGWGNLGGGFTQLVMPLIFGLISSSSLAIGSPRFVAWRLAFFVPGTLHIVSGLLVLCLSQDLPDGNFRDLTHRGLKVKDRLSKVFLACFLSFFLFSARFGAPIML